MSTVAAASGTPRRTSPDGSRTRPGDWGVDRNAVAVAAAWVVLLVVSALNRPDFVSHQTLLAVTFTMTITGVLAVGQSLVAVSGALLDLSLPVLLILPAWVVASLLTAGVSTPAAVLAAIAAGAAWGAVNATIIVFGRLNPIIVTLATSFSGVAILLLLFRQAQAPQSSALRQFGSGFFLGLPNIWWPMVALVLLAAFLLSRTRYGRRTTAVGGSSSAARARGISLRRTRYGVFTVAGACGGLAGVLFAASNGSFTPAAGASFLLPVIAAVILAGVSLSGGRGNLLLLLLSVGFLSTVPTSLVFFGLSPDFVMVVQGLLLVVAVSIDGRAQKRERTA